MRSQAALVKLPEGKAPGLGVIAHASGGGVNAAVMRGGVYLTLRYALSMLVSLGNVFVLTWWIGPHAYGTFVTAVGLTTFLASLTRFGVDAYLVRSESAPDTRQYNVAFTLVLTTSTVLMLLGAALVPLLERWYSEREFVLPYLALLLSVPLTGIAGIPTARLERELKFGVVAGIELGGQLSAFVVAGLLAWRGFGVWAPVVGLFTWQAVVLTAAWRAARFSPRLQFDAAHARTMLAFGVGFSASLRTWQLRTLVNPLLVGRFAGPECVAYVAFAVRVVEALGFIRIAAGRLAIAALARLQHDREQFRAVLERALTIQVVTIGPLLWAFAVTGPWVVPRFMGERWLPSLEVYPLIAAGVLCNSVFNLQASALFVLGRQWTVMWAYASHVVMLAAAAVLLLPRMGIAGYGWAELIACGAYPLIGYPLSRLIAVSYRKLVPLTAVFGLPLFLVSINYQRARWVALVGGAAAIGYAQLAEGRGAIQGGRWACGTIAGEVRHLRRFMSKAMARGWPYVRSLAEYKARSTLYDIRRTAGRVFCLLRHGQMRAEAGKPARGTAFDCAFHFTADEIASIVAAIPDELKRRTAAEADEAMRHRFRFRGKERSFGASIDWKAAGSDTSWAWDLNRHGWFVRLATAFYYTGNPDTLRELAAVWRDWIQRNPAGTGFNWQYPFEVAARLGNWTWAYVLLAYSGIADASCLTELRAGLREHAEYLHSHLEYHWPNNHLLLEAKSLYEFALVFPELDGSFLGHARSHLEREVREQVLPDGAHSELCSMYHRVIAGELGQLARLGERWGKPLPGDLRERIARMTEFSRAMRRQDGSSALLGDSAAEDTCLRFDFARPDYSDLNYWVAAGKTELEAAPFPSGTRQLRFCSSPASRDGKPRLYQGAGISTFRDAGYAFLTRHGGAGEIHVTFDFGRFSACRSPNHGHCDALSFELHAHGHSLIVDPGTYLPWNSRIPWARHFRSTFAHNTLTIDGREQSELSDYSDVRRTAQVKLLRQESTESRATIAAECIPYWAMPRHMRQRREITLEKQRLTIRDEVIGEGEHLLQWSFQFPPELDVFSSGDCRLAARLPGQETDCLSLSARGDKLPGLGLHRGESEPLRGWVSRNSAEVVPAYAAVYTIKTCLPFEVAFVIDLVDPSKNES
jgi:O-antigen/teichoic acid export membrane protein/uncharacterized heparinase superfamily protein